MGTGANPTIVHGELSDGSIVTRMTLGSTDYWYRLSGSVLTEISSGIYDLPTSGMLRNDISTLTFASASGISFGRAGSVLLEGFAGTLSGTPAYYQYGELVFLASSNALNVFKAESRESTRLDFAIMSAPCRRLLESEVHSGTVTYSGTGALTIPITANTAQVTIQSVSASGVPNGTRATMRRGETALDTGYSTSRYTLFTIWDSSTLSLISNLPAGTYTYLLSKL